jgi:hypothetical protein
MNLSTMCSLLATSALLPALALVSAPPVAAQSTLLTLDGNQADAEFGSEVANAGDVDADGYDDIIVGQPAYDRLLPNQTLLLDAGRVVVYSGRTGAVLYSILGSEDGELFGLSVAGGGNVDGDAHADFAVGRPGALDSQGFLAGGVTVYRGVDGSVSASWVYETGTSGWGWYGWAVAFANVRGGGGFPFDEVVAGMPFKNGLVAITAGGVQARNGTTGFLASTHLGTNTNARLGWSVARVGDWTGDGLDEVAVGSPTYGTTPLPQIGRVDVFRMSMTNPAPIWAGDGGPGAGTQYGWALAGMGDWNGDGWPELVVGAPGANGGTGFARVVLGPAGATGPQFAGPQAGARYGGTVAGAGDVDGNGTPEIVVSAEGYDAGVAPFQILNAGYVEVRAPGGIPAVPLMTWIGTQSDSNWGNAVGGGGDVNGDGSDDVLFGGPYVDVASGADRGQVVVRTWVDADASHAKFGVGLAGTLGVPDLDVTAEPVLGQSFGLLIGNSNPAPAAALLHVGFVQAALPAKGGTLYTLPWQSIPILLSGPVNLYQFSLPLDLGLTQLELYLQVTTPDPGAPVGISFTNALKLVLGV